MFLSIFRKVSRSLNGKFKTQSGQVAGRNVWDESGDLSEVKYAPGISQAYHESVQLKCRDTTHAHMLLVRSGQLMQITIPTRAYVEPFFQSCRGSFLVSHVACAALC